MTISEADSNTDMLLIDSSHRSASGRAWCVHGLGGKSFCCSLILCFDVILIIIYTKYEVQTKEN